MWLEDPLGQHPPPSVTSEWQKGLRGSYHNVHNTWFKFDPTKYHAVEQVKSGTRTIKPLSPQEEKELREHINSGHVNKSNLCKGCLLSEGPRKLHERVRDVDKATHVLHIDIAGPYIESHEGHHYFLVGALRLPDRPLLIDVRLLKTRTSVEVCAALERMTSFFESLSFEGFEITDPPRIKRLHSDRAREFTALYFQKFLSNHRSAHAAFAPAG